MNNLLLVWITACMVCINAECEVGQHVISSESGSSDFIWTGKNSKDIGDASIAAIGTGKSFTLRRPRILWLTLNPVAGNEFILTNFCIEFQDTKRALLSVCGISNQRIARKLLRFDSNDGTGKGCFNLDPRNGMIRGVNRVKLSYVRVLSGRNNIKISNVDVKGCIGAPPHPKCIGKQEVTARNRSSDFLWTNKFGKAVPNDAAIGTGLSQSIPSRDKLYISLNSDALGESAFTLTTLCADFSNTKRARITLHDDTGKKVDSQTLRFKLNGAAENMCYDMGETGFDGINTIRTRIIVPVVGDSIVVSNVSVVGCLMPSTEESTTTEAPTTTKEPLECPSYQYECIYTAGDDPNECISSSKVCNGECDCSDCQEEYTESCMDNCSLHYFQCDDGFCTQKRPYSVYCDGDTDCPDGSDEKEDCTCVGFQFDCQDEDLPQCVVLYDQCDGFKDCENGRDEYDCGCLYFDEFECADKSKCILLTDWCDGVSDCDDGSDEPDDCTKCHPEKQFTCDDGECIYTRWLCDNEDDCDDGEDEDNCFGECAGDDYECPNNSSNTKQCIESSDVCNGECDCDDCLEEYTDSCVDNCRSQYFQCDDGFCTQEETYLVYCDGSVDCPDGSDEKEDCTCTRDQFDCEESNTAHCIPLNDQCDYIPQCLNGKDENDCPCGSFRFQCADKSACVFLNYWCNGYTSCNDGSDELENCTKCHPEKHFTCDDGDCIYTRRVCDGFKDCEDYEDEINCVRACDDDEFQCADHPRCHDVSDWCDNITDCDDGSDEPVNCTPCHPQLQEACIDGKCILVTELCDGNYDCRDWGDEVDCDKKCIGSYTHVCDNGAKCYSDEQKCDYKYDCDDKSDEANCRCRARCDDGRCIDRDSLCDGYNDCPNGEDENECPCRHGSKACSLDTSKCVSVEHFCDGHPDCPQGEDEYNCTSGCAAPHLLCSDLHCIHVEKVCDGTVDCEQGEDENDCTSVCGTRSESLVEPLIIHGDTAKPGYWPWQVGLKFRNKLFCGGSVLNEDWIVTAAHCVEDNLTINHYTVRMGTNKLSEYDPEALVLNLEKIIMHSSYTSFRDGYDIALLKVKGKIPTTDYIRPVCLPKPYEVFQSYLECYLSGWGRVNYHLATLPEDLQEARMTIWTLGEAYCSLGYEEEIMICAGLQYNQATSCLGDSGGPLVCRNEEDIWTLVGIASFGETGCVSNSYFTKVSVFVDWIKSTMENN